MGTLSTHWNTDALIRQPYELLCVLSTTLTKSGSTGAFLSRPAVFTCHINRTFLCLAYLFFVCLSQDSSWGKATQTQSGGRKEYPSNTSSTPHYAFQPQREDTNRKKRIISSSATSVASNSSVEWNTDAWSKEMLCKNMSRAATKLYRANLQFDYS